MNSEATRLRELVDAADSALESLPTAPAPLSAAAVNRAGLLAARARLTDDLQAELGEHRFELRFLGGSENYHQVPIDFFGRVARDVQSAVDHLVYVRVEGTQKTGGGRFPEEIRKASQLELAAVGHGSLVVGLQAPPVGPGEQPSMEGIADDSVEDLPEREVRRTRMMVRDQALDIILDAIEAAVSEDESRIEDVVSEFGSRAAVERLARLVKLLGRTQTTIEATHRPGFGLRARRVRISPGGSSFLADQLEDVKTETSEHEISGTLSGVVWGTGGRFRLDVESGPWPTVLSGQVATTLRDSIRDSFDRPVIAHVVKTVTSSPGRRRTTYRLTDVEVRTD